MELQAEHAPSTSPFGSFLFRLTREDASGSPGGSQGHVTSKSTMTSDTFLSPYSFAARNSLCSTSDYSLRRRRPITLKIMPRLSLPGRSTSAPATTDGEWPSIAGFKGKSMLENEDLDVTTLKFLTFFLHNNVYRFYSSRKELLDIRESN